MGSANRQFEREAGSSSLGSWKQHRNMLSWNGISFTGSILVGKRHEIKQGISADQLSLFQLCSFQALLQLAFPSSGRSLRVRKLGKLMILSRRRKYVRLAASSSRELSEQSEAPLSERSSQSSAAAPYDLDQKTLRPRRVGRRLCRQCDGQAQAGDLRSAGTGLRGLRKHILVFLSAVLLFASVWLLVHCRLLLLRLLVGRQPFRQSVILVVGGSVGPRLTRSLGLCTLA